MLQFVIRKLLHKRWMVCCLLIGNILLVSIACCNPMYTQAVLQRMLISKMDSYIVNNNKYPGTVTLTGAVIRRNDNFSFMDKFAEVEEMAESLPEKMGVPAIEQITHYYLDTTRMTPDVPRRENDVKSLTIGFLTGLPEHISMISGRMYEPGINENGCYEVIMSLSAMANLDLLIGECFTGQTLTDANGDLVRLQVVGVYTFSDAEDIYWVRTPTSYRAEVFMDEDTFRANFADMDALRNTINAYWYNVLDYEAMRGDDVSSMYAVLSDMKENFSTGNYRYYDNCSAIFEDFLVKREKVNVTLLVLQVPIFVLLAAFIFMVSRQMLEMEQSEISILKSRGAGKGQIIGIYLLQSTLLSVVGLAAGIPLGMWLCQVLGSANAFLEFVSRKPLDVRFGERAAVFAAAAAVFSVCTMVLPVFRYSSVSIVNQKQSKHRRSEKPLWQKTFLDFILLGVSLYGLYSFNGQKDILAERVANGASLDPLLFMCSSLFIVGAGLVAVRLVPGIIWLVFTVGRKLWSPALYASFLRVIRTRKSQGFIMVFLVMTIALGMFNAQAARTINGNEEDRLTYLTGTDIVLAEIWENNADQIESTKPEDIIYEEPDFGRYATCPDIEMATKVLRNSSGLVVLSGKTLKNINIMGINTKEFGQVIRFKDDLLPMHINNFLNAISQNSHAILVSRNFADDMGVKLGDVLNYKCSLGDTIRGIVYGFVEYWPTYNAVSNQIGVDGLEKQVNEYLIVGHLSQMQSAWGVTPYQVWIKASDTSFIYDFIAEYKIDYSLLLDIEQQTVALKNDPIFQGTNGILTVGFIVVLILCATGFLIYWILSIQSRSLQFGIFRAMGMSFREIISMLLNEQLFISGTAIGIGALIGYLSSRLFIPLIQISYAPVDEVIPIKVISEKTDLVRLFGVVGCIMLICIVILGVLISRIRITQALKLGED
ncbi:MAG: FtsX-like permease family protein [Clostridia bacterium]|nr:FtsX-like permease family protein [Clostridia bacterium]